ncbi:unnamed protein product [Nyctereutes procyonoides]|uniref:(raccoon dog) hypothetical protein n=1 Tax=Nyctereutes procyonoides TaxID=34880 RepID=A0A811ZEV3_NYCPR|nr:unnamed protein product [Nyctereutes procyonoides]
MVPERLAARWQTGSFGMHGKGRKIQQNYKRLLWKEKKLLSEEEVVQPLPEEQGSTDQASSEGHCRKNKSLGEKAQGKCEQVKAKETKLYKTKKMEALKSWAKSLKKDQPNLNSPMEHLLKKYIY